MKKNITIIYPDNTIHNVVVTRVDETLDGRILITYFDNERECFTEIVNINGVWHKNPDHGYFPPESELMPYNPILNDQIINSLPNKMYSINNKPYKQATQMASSGGTIPPTPPLPPKNKKDEEIKIQFPIPKPKEKKDTVKQIKKDQYIDIYIVMLDKGENVEFYNIQKMINDLLQGKPLDNYPIYKYGKSDMDNSYAFNYIMPFLTKSNRLQIAKIIQQNKMIRINSELIKECLIPDTNIRLNFAYCRDKDFYNNIISRSKLIIPDKNAPIVPINSTKTTSFGFDNHIRIEEEKSNNNEIRDLLEAISNRTLKAKFIGNSPVYSKSELENISKNIKNVLNILRNEKLNEMFDKNNHTENGNSYRK